MVLFIRTRARKTPVPAKRIVVYYGRFDMAPSYRAESL
jgi:hypothetical protein